MRRNSPPQRRRASARSARWRAGLAAASLATSAPAGAADLSPAHWPADVRARVEQAELRVWPTETRIVEGDQAIVATSVSPIAAQAGLEALRQGGTAADAAVAIAMTQIATMAGSVISYAGTAEVLYYEAASGHVHALDAGWNTYREETDPATIPGIDLSRFGGGAAEDASGQEGRKTLVPGFMAGMGAFHARFGVLPLADLLAPAIWYADEGMALSPLLAAFFAQYEPFLVRTPEGREFAHPGGDALPRLGEPYRQPELARTLRGVAAEGPAFMYTGAWGRDYVATVRREGGKVTMADMAAYRVVWREPLSMPFAGTTVFAPNEINSSACRVLGGLALVEAMTLRDRPPFWENPGSFRAYADIMRFSVIGPLLGPTQRLEQEKGLESTCKGRTTPQYAAAMAPHIGELMDLSIGPASWGSHSSAIVVIDRHGNVAALVHTINTTPWGDTGIVVGGVPISNAAALQKVQLVQLAPGSRIPSMMAPVIVLRDGHPVLAVATVGTSLVQETIKVVAGLLGGIAPDQVMAAPPWLMTPDVRGPRIETVPAGAYSEAFLEGVRATGLNVQQTTDTGALRGTASIGLIGEDGKPRSVEVAKTLGVAAGD